MLAEPLLKVGPSERAWLIANFALVETAVPAVEMAVPAVFGMTGPAAARAKIVVVPTDLVEAEIAETAAAAAAEMAEIVEVETAATAALETAVIAALEIAVTAVVPATADLVDPGPVWLFQALLAGPQLSRVAPGQILFAQDD